METLNAIKILISEHKTTLIMISILENLVKDIKNFEKINVEFYKKIIDFFKTYVDECHHGKEEKVLFFKLTKKPMLDNEKKMLNELLDEHVQARKLVALLDQIKESKDFEKISSTINDLVVLYKMHIHKENDKFFYPAFKYFSEDEKIEMLKEFIRLDAKIIHEKYLRIVNDLSKLIKK